MKYNNRPILKYQIVNYTNGQTLYNIHDQTTN